MKINFQKFIKLLTIIFVVGFVFFGSSNFTEAATRTWDGSTSGSWSVAANWQENVAPVTGDDLVFPVGAANLSNTNDLTENTIINSITLSGSGYTLSGNPIILGPGLAGITDSVASGGNTIALDIRLDATRDIIVTNTAESLTISGRIAGVGGFNKEGTGTLILSGANTYGGLTKINVGVINARHATALGTIAAGTEVVGGAALELQGNISISYEALALRGWGVNGTGGALRNISDNNTFGGLITLSSAGGTVIKSDSGTLTLKGGTTGNAPLIFDGAGNMVFSTAPLAGSGTITKNGAGTVTLNFPNTNTGAWTINAGTILYGVDNAIMTGAITVTGGTLDIATFSDMVGTVTLGTLDLASGTITGTTGVLSSGTWTVYNGTISAIIAGQAGGLTKSTPGTVILTRPNLYTGGTTISAGILEIQNNTSLGVIDGTTTVSGGATLQINGSGLSIPEYITFNGTGHLYTGAIRNRGGNNSLTGLLTLGTVPMIISDSGTTLTIDAKGISVTSISFTVGGEGNTTFTSTAPMYGTSAALTKNGTGTLTIGSVSNYTGTTTINRGTVVLSGAGAIPISAIAINSGGTLTLDNTSAVNFNRVSDTANLTMRGGNFNFLGNGSTASLETAGALTLSEGHNITTVTPGAGGSTTMTFASLARTAGATVLFRGTSLGSNPAANISTIMFNSAPAVLGGGGAANTTTTSVIKGAFGDNSLSGTGTDMVVHSLGNINGIRLLNGAGFSGEYSATLTANANVKLTGDVAASAVSINSLILNGYSITNASATITISSGSLAGNILMNSATSIAGANTVLGITNNHLDILATASGTISAVIGTAVAGSVAISGTGSVTLSTASLYTSTTFINGTTLFLGASNVLSSGGVTVVGGTLNIGTNSDTVGAVTLQNGSITGSSGVLAGTSYSLREGTVSAILGGGAAVVTRVTTSAAADSVVTLSGNNTYTGATTVSSGILKLGAAGSGGNTPLGTTGGGTTIANIASLDLNGYTLSTAEAITSLAGLGFGPGSTVANGNSNMGALMNSSPTPVSYSGAITLGTTPRINADYGALTISSAISTANTLTIGGFSDSTFSGVIGSGAVVLVKDGIGTLTLSNGNSSYTGSTTISAGTIKLGAIAVGSNSPLGTIGGATIISTGARLDLNGFSLGIAEPINTLSGVGYGLGDFASGALMNSSGSAVAWTGTITLAVASTIKADSGAITLSAITGAFGLTLGGTGTGTVSGVFGAGAATLTKINTGTWTMSGVNTFTGATSINLGTLKFGVNDAAGGGPLGTAANGTSILSGAVLDLNGFSASALAEALTINGRGEADGGALTNSAGGTRSYLGVVTQATDSRISIPSGTTTFSGATGAVTGAFALYVGGAGNITFSTLVPASALSLTKQGAGTLTVTGVNAYTGYTRVDAGTFIYGATTTLVGTNLIMNGGTFNMNATTDTIGTVTLIGGTISNGTLTAATSYTLENGTISAIIAGAIPVTKNTNNNVILSGVNTISSTMVINAGTVTISGSGSDVSVTAITVNLGGTLTLDNSSTAVASRILDTLVLTMNGGNLNFIGNGAGTSSETLGQLLLSSGHSIVTVTPGAGGSTTLTFGAATGFSRTAGATVLFRGTNMRSAAGANVSTLLFTNAPALLGAGGAAGTTTMSVLKGAFGDTSLSGTGSDMVTIISTKLSPLAAGEYAGDLQTANANVKLTADRAAVATNTNSLITNTFNITNPGGAITIPISSGSLAGNILINSTDDIAGANTTLGITTTELDILATANSTISAIIGTATTGSVVLSGTGNVTLSAANLYTSTTFINGATLTAGASNVISSGGVTAIGGTYNLNGNSDTIGALSLTAGTVATGAGTLTGNGSFTTATNANFASIITGNLGLGANATFTIGDGLMDNDAVISAVISGGFTFAKAGNGVLELAGSNTFSGATTISAGILRLGAAGGGTNTPLGTTAGITTVSGTSSALDLNGFTLGTAEALTLSNAGLATGGLQNTSSTAVTYSGLITLSTGAGTIISNYGDINISNTGNITGNTFGLTIGGAGNGTFASNLNTTSGTLTKNGLGVWTVSSSASTFTGAVTVSAGTFKLGAAGGGTNTPLGTNAGGISITSGAIFDLNGFTLGTAETATIAGTGIASSGAFINSSNNTISYSGALVLGTTPRIVNAGTGVLTFTGAISGNNALTVVTVGDIIQSTGVWSGTGSLVKEGSGTLTLGGAHSTTGAMTVSTGTLKLGASGGAANTPLGTNAGGVTVALGAVLDLSTFNLGGASTYETLGLSGTGIKNGGALISSAASGTTYFGATTITANSIVTNSGAGTIRFNSTVTAAASINLWVNGTGPTIIGGAYGAASSATLTKDGAGTLTISAVATNTGLVRINGGTLAYGIADALSTSAVTVAGGTWDLAGYSEGGTTLIGAVTLIDGSIVNTGGAASIITSATYTLEKGTISAVLGGTVVAAIAKNTGGQVILSGDNTFSGAAATIAVNAGSLNLRHNNALGGAANANTTTISAGATLELENSITIPAVKAITANGTGVGNVGAIRNITGTNTISANVTLGTTNVGINSDSGTLSFPTMSGAGFSAIFGGAGSTSVSGVIGTTSGGLTKHGAGTLTLTGSNTYTGVTTIMAGTVVANTTTAIGNESATNTLVLAGGTLQASGTITSAATRAFIVSSNSTSTINTNGNAMSIAGAFTTTGGFTKAGAGALTVTGTTTIYGDTTVSAGTFAPTNVVITGTATQSIAGFTGTGTVSMTKVAGTATLAGNVGGTGLTINGTGGTLNLGTARTHTFTGDVTLTAGTLNADSSTLNLNSTSATAWGGTGSVFSAGTGTVNFGGANQTLSATTTTFNNLTFSGSGTKTFTSATTINGNFDNQSGTPSYATWNPSDKGAAIILSNGNLTETGDNLGYGFVRATQGKSSGKWYWELLVNESTHAYPGIISATPDVDGGTLGRTNGEPDGWSISEFQTKWNNDAGVAYGNVDFVDNDIIGVALDMDAGEITYYINGVSQGVAFTGLTGTLYPAAGTFGNIGALTANFGASAFAETVPGGYNSGVYTGGSVAINTGNQTITLKGNFTNTGTALNAGSSNIILDGTATQAIAGFTTTGTVSVTKIGGAVTFGGDITASSVSFPSAISTVNLGSNTFTLSGTGTVWDMASSASVTVNGGNSTIKLTDSSATGKTFAGGGKTYNNIWFAPGAGTGSYTISGDNTFNDFKDDGSIAHSILFTTGSTQHLTSWNVRGNPGQLITINSSDNSGTHTLYMDGSGAATADYLNIQHSIATPNGRWFAGDNSVNNNSVATAGSGWFFKVESIYRGGGGGSGGEVQSGSGNCSDGIQNGDESGIDTGGRCAALSGTCSDGIQNGNETGVDTGGRCGSGGGGGGDGGSGTCYDSIQNGDETGVDTGGRCEALSGTCSDGIQNGNETGVDTGGRCGSGGGGDTGFLYRRRMIASVGHFDFSNLRGYFSGIFRF